jgi:hypothetical protein
MSDLRAAALTVLTAWARTESPDWGKRFAAALDDLRDALATTGQPDIERTAPGLDYRLRCTCVTGTVNGKHDSGCPEATAPYQPGTSYTARVMAEAGIPEATAPEATVEGT